MRKPLVAMVADQLRRKILTRQLPAGRPLVPYHVIGDLHAVNRMTARRACYFLRDEGLLHLTGRAPVVNLPPAVTALHRVLDALNTGDQPSPADVRLLTAMVVELWDNRRDPYAGFLSASAPGVPETEAGNAE